MLQDRLDTLNDLAALPALLQRLGLSAHPDAAALLRSGQPRPLMKRAAKAMRRLTDAEAFWT